MYSKRSIGNVSSKEYDDTDSASDGDDNTESDVSLSDSSLSSSFLSRKDISRARWTKEEDERLRQVIDIYGTQDWKMIALALPNRSELQCYHRWQKVLNPDLVKGPWTQEEDEKVVELVDRFGPKRWSLISKMLVGRTGKQCRERWHNHLNPDIKKSAWTKEEDCVIYEAHKKLGNRWAEIAKLLPGRTDNAIKNHWNSTMKRKVETCNPYTPSKPCSTPVYTQTGRKPANTSNMYTPDSDFMNANSIRDALKMGGPGKRVVRTLYPIGHDTLAQEKGESSKVDPSAPVESPSKWFVVDEAGEISPFRDIHSLLEAGTFDDTKSFPYELSPDVISSTPIKFTQMSAGGTIDYHFDGQALSSLSKESAGLIPITSPVTSKFSSPPTILRKSRHKQRSRTSSTSFNVSLNSSMGSSLDSSTPFKSLLAESNTPQGTPIKALPFSPSQFLNVSSTPATSSTPLQLTSTPIGGNHSQATPTMLAKQGTFRTPRIRRALIESTPRTPTPFKDALAAIKKMPHTPNQLADISEIIAKDEREGLRAAKLKREAEAQAEVSPTKRVRKSLSSCMKGEKENDDKIEKGDEGDESILASTLLMSPPIGAMTQTTALTSAFSAKSLDDAFNIPTTPSPGAVRKAGRAMRSKVKGGQPSKPASCDYFKPTATDKDNDWWKITLGQTKDQQYMSSQARRMVLREHKPRSLVL